MNPRTGKLSALALAAVAGTLALGAWAANAGEAGDKERHHRGPAHSVERVAMRNLIVRELATRTGRSEAEIGEMLKEQHPHEVAQTLGIERDAMKEIFKSARTTLIDEAARAQLITAAQAEELRNAPPPQRFRHARHRGDGRGPQVPAEAAPAGNGQ